MNKSNLQQIKTIRLRNTNGLLTNMLTNAKWKLLNVLSVGGPLLNNFGNVVGVSVAKLDTEASLEQFGVLPENVNFGIKLSTLKSFLTANEIEFFEGNAKRNKKELFFLIYKFLLKCDL